MRQRQIAVADAHKGRATTQIREDVVVRNKAIDLALGNLPNGARDILGLWIEGSEGGKFWLKVFNDLTTRSVADILIAVTNG